MSDNDHGLSNESVAFLMLIIAEEKENDHEYWRAAWEELYKRCHMPFYKACVHRCENIGIPDITMQLYNLTWDKVLKSASSYQARFEDDPNKEQNNFLAWMNTIAERALCDLLRNKDAIPSHVVTSMEELGYEIPEQTESATPPPDTPEMKALRLHLDSLSIRDKQICLYYAESRNLENPSARVGAGVTKKIAEEFGTTQDNVRQIVSRCKKAVKQKV